MTGTMAEKKDEYLRLSGDLDFQGRINSIFGCLDKLEPEQKGETEETKSKPLDPQAPKKAPKHVPDHVLHPEKWTKYSLEDDGTEKNTGMTGDALNRHVALSFMDEIRKRKESPEKHTESESDVEMSEKHVFSKSVIKHKMQVDESNSKSQFAEGVNVMPEYVVGESPAKTPKKERSTQPADKQLHSPGDKVCLGHLDEKDTVENSSEEKVMVGSASEITKGVSDPVEEPQDAAKFNKRKVKARSGLRAHKSSTEDE